MQSKKIKVLVVDDSSLFRQMIIQHLSAQPGIEVIGFAINAYDAKNKIPVLKPDVMTLDVEMPGLNGIEFLKQLLPINPIPVVLVSSLNLSVFDALSAGAVDFVRKPDMSASNSKSVFFSSLISKIRAASISKVRMSVRPSLSSNMPVSGTSRQSMTGHTPKPQKIGRASCRERV